MVLAELSTRRAAADQGQWQRLTEHAFPSLRELPEPLQHKVPVVGRHDNNAHKVRQRLMPDLFAEGGEFEGYDTAVAAPFFSFVANIASQDDSPEGNGVREHYMRVLLEACNRYNPEIVTGLTLQREDFPAEGVIVIPENKEENAAFTLFISLHNLLGVTGQSLLVRHFPETLGMLTDNMKQTQSGDLFPEIMEFCDRHGYFNTLRTFYEGKDRKKAAMASVPFAFAQAFGQKRFALDADTLGMLVEASLMFRYHDFPAEHAIPDGEQARTQSAIALSAAKLDTTYDDIAECLLKSIGFRFTAYHLAKQFPADPGRAEEILGTLSFLDQIGYSPFEVMDGGSTVDPHISRRTTQTLMREARKILPELRFCEEETRTAEADELHEKTHIGLNILGLRHARRPIHEALGFRDDMCADHKTRRATKRQRVENVVEAVVASMGYASEVQKTMYYKYDQEGDRVIDLFADVFTCMTPEERERTLRGFVNDFSLRFRPDPLPATVSMSAD